MRKQLLTSAAVLALSAGAAFASDLPAHKGPPPAPTPAPFSWTGFYIGVQGGFGWGQESDNFSAFTDIPLDSFNVSGPIGGAHIGYDQQINSLVIGVVADIEASDIQGKKSSTYPFWSRGQAWRALSMQNTWQSSFYARAGVAFDRLLVYGTGGLAIANDHETNTVSDTFGDYASRSQARRPSTDGP